MTTAPAPTITFLPILIPWITVLPVPKVLHSSTIVSPERLVPGRNVEKFLITASCPIVQSKFIITCFPILIFTVKIFPEQIILPSPIDMEFEILTLGCIIFQIFFFLIFYYFFPCFSISYSYNGINIFIHFI